MTCPESSPEYQTNPDEPPARKPRRRKTDTLDLALVGLFLALLHGAELWKELMLQILPEPDPEAEAKLDQLLQDLANRAKPHHP